MTSEFDTRTTTIQRPAPFIEAAGTAFTGRLTPLLDPSKKTDIASLYQAPAAQNILAQQGLQRAATSAGLGDVTFGGPGGTISDVAPGTGVAAFEPFLAESQRLAGVDPATGQVTATGMEAALQPFMSPFQQQIIDATTAAFENRRAQDRLAMRDAAIASGAFGGARQGVQEGVYDAQTNIGLRELQANLLAQNFAQAQAARQAAMANQQGLMSVVPAAQQTVAANLAQTGAGQQALQQAIIDQNMAQAREQAFEEQQRLGFFGQQFAPFTGGFGAASQFTTNTVPPPSTLNTILGVGTMAGGLLGGIGSIVSGGG
jgi:hypothetical protein|tara:strand:- start:468 stop:1415 length:948 start_codon:yes stop_codon:yes gene_type:complete